MIQKTPSDFTGSRTLPPTLQEIKGNVLFNNNTKIQNDGVKMYDSSFISFLVKPNDLL